MADDALVHFFRDLAAEAGTAPVDDEEADAVLELAKVVAHRHVRRYAPVAAYAAGLAIGADTTPGERARRLREVVAASRALDPADDDG